jgi:hypothetical protein
VKRPHEGTVPFGITGIDDDAAGLGPVGESADETWMQANVDKPATRLQDPSGLAYHRGIVRQVGVREHARHRRQ